MTGSRAFASFLTLTEVSADNRSERARLRSESLLIAMLSSLLALAALAYCARHDLLLLYGDAVAHLHIARRVFDSLNPGFRQLGSVWLPLPHLLLVPFVIRLDWWQNGLAGAIPSMCCYIFGTVGIYCLARLWLEPAVAAVAAALYGTNPGLLYMQTTAMTEPLFLAEMIWATLLLAKHQRALRRGEESPAARLLTGAGLVLVAAIFTRYDGWIFAAFAWVLVVVQILRQGQWRGSTGGAFIFFTAMLTAAPAIWLAYNAKQFGDPLDFLRGPYSAKAIELRTATPGASHYPGWHSMPVAALYLLKAAELGATSLRCANSLLVLTIAGTLAALMRWWREGIAVVMLFWIPLPFYAYSIAFGSVPLFIPLWWPHSFYNTRYGMEMLPIFAMSLALLLACGLRLLRNWRPQACAWVMIGVCAVIVANSVSLIRATPLVMQEAIANSKTRIPFERALARNLVPLAVWHSGPILMYTSAHVGALQRAAIPLKRTINETDYYQWPGALRDPAEAASLVVAIDGDEVAKAVEEHPQSLNLISVICSSGQPCARIYSSSDRGSQMGTPR